MSLDLDKLEQKRERGGKLEARCPACAELGEDVTGNHLFILDSGLGKWGCVVNAGSHGHEHRKRILKLVGMDAATTPRPAPVLRPRPACRPVRPLPPLRTPAQHHLDHVAKLRGWHTPDGMETLVERGQLFIGDVYDAGAMRPAWICTDSTRANVQARRMDGGKWTLKGELEKAKSLPGTTTTRSIGASGIGSRPQVWITEGTPDFCAAPIVAKLAGLDLDQIAFVCVTGTGNDIHADDLHHFKGKAVTIAMHHDADHGKGAEAAHRWARQLFLAGAAQVRGFNFACTGGKDLADYLCRLAKPIKAESADHTLGAHETAPISRQPAPVRALLIPLEGPWIDGARYRLAGAHEARSRLPLFIEDPVGDTRRAFGCLIYDPLP